VSKSQTLFFTWIIGFLILASPILQTHAQLPDEFLSETELQDSAYVSTWCTNWLDTLEAQPDRPVLPFLQAQDSILALSGEKYSIAMYLISYTLGEGHLIVNQVPTALEWHQQALSRAKLIWGETSLTVAEVLNAMAIDRIYMGDFQEGLRDAKQALDIRKSLLPPDHSDIAQGYNNVGVFQRAIGNIAEAISSTERAIAIWEQQDPPPIQDLCTAYTNVAINYRRMGRYQSALSCYDRIFSYRDSLPAVAGTGKLSLSAVYNNIAVLYRKLGDYGNAIENYQQSIDLELTQVTPNPRSLAIKYDNIAKAYSAIQYYDSSMTYLETALAIKQEYLEPENPVIYDSYLNMGEVHLQHRQPHLALPYLQKAYDFFETFYQKDHERLANLLETLGHAYTLTGVFDEGIRLQKQALEMRERLFSPDSPGVIDSYLLLARAHLDQGQNPTQALVFVQSAFERLFPAQSFSPLPDQLPHIRDKQVIRVLGTTGDVFAQLGKSGNSKAWAESWKAYQLALSAIDSVLIRFRPASSKTQLYADTWPIIESAIQVAHQRYQQTKDLIYLEEALAACEKSKGMIFKEALKSNSTYLSTRLPADLIEAETQLKEQLIHIGSQLNNASTDPNDDTYATLRMQQFRLQQSHDSLLHIISQNYPDYFELKYASRPLDLSRIQAYLTQREMDMITYFAGVDSLYAFIIRPDKLELYPLGSVQEIDSLVFHLRDQLQQPPNSQTSVTAFAQPAYELYRHILAPIHQKLPDLSERLLVLPGGSLGYLPFELLLTSPAQADVNFKQLSYLTLQHTLTYGYATHMWSAVAEAQLKTTRPRRVLALAPDFSVFESESATRETWGLLLHNQTEVRAITAGIASKSLLGSQATEQRFRQEAAQYEILHIATHATVDNRNPLYSHFILHPYASADGRIELAEVLNMALDAELVVLSACETGYGKYLYGEGVVSMARGFTYAGARALLTSMWQVNDAATANLMQDFYTALKAGLPKDQAMAQARNLYLQSSDPIGAHPYYWGGFVLSGDPHPIAFAHDTRTLWIIVGIVVTIILLLGLIGKFIIQSKRRSMNSKITVTKS